MARSKPYSLKWPPTSEQWDRLDGMLRILFEDINRTASTETTTTELTGVLDADQGGTGLDTFAIGDLLVADSTSTLARLADVAVGSVLTSGGVNTVPAWAQVDLSSMVTGKLPIANGGTNLSSFAQGDLIYADAVNSLVALAKNTSATRYLSNTGTSNAPAWAQVNLANGVTGTLPAGNGGTGVTSLGNLTKGDDTNVTLTLGGTPTGALITSASITAGWTGTLAVTRGGTGLGSLSQGDLIYGSASNTFSALAKNTTSTRYLSNTGTSNNPAWAQVDLTNGVTGVLPVANGGTGTSTGGQVLVAKVNISESDLEAMPTTRKTLVAAPGANQVIVPIGVYIEINITTAYGNNPTVILSLGGTDTQAVVTNTTAIGFNGTGKRSALISGLATSANYIYASSDPTNQALTMRLNVALTSPGTGVGTAIVSVVYYIADVS